MSNLDVLRELYDARTKLEVDRLFANAHPECVFQIVGSPELGAFTQRCEGIPAIRAALERLMLWDLSQVENVTTHECGDTIYVHRRGTAIYVPDGSTLDTEFIDKLTFRDGEIIEYLQFLDTFAIASFMAGKQAAAN